MTAVFEDDLASVRRANAELQHRLDERTAERDEALAREAATAEVLQVINTSPGNLAPVFESILDKALRLCEATSGALATWDGEYFNRVATRGPWTDPADPTPRQYLEPRRKPAPGSLAERIRRGENIISTSDLTQSDAFNSSPALQSAARFGMRSCVVVALRMELNYWATSRSFAGRFGRFLRKRSRCCRTSQRRQSSRWKTRGCWTNCTNAPIK